MGDQRQATRRPNSAHSPRPIKAAPPDQQLTFGTARDGASLARVALSLQRAAGNRATAASLAGIRAAGANKDALEIVNPVQSAAAPPRGGAKRIAAESPDKHAAGVTSLPVVSPPDVVVGAPTEKDGRWLAPINPTSVTAQPALSLYPGAGIHDEEPTPGGLEQVRDVTPAASAEIKAGEEEHLSDLEWARHLAYDQVAEAINRAASETPMTGATAEEAKALAMYAVRSKLPDKARWPNGKEPFVHFRDLYSKLVAVTKERDDPNGWHNIGNGIVSDPAEKKRLKVPQSKQLLRYQAGTTQVGQHPSEAEVKARYEQQPAAPLGPPPAGVWSQPAPKPAPKGDFEPPRGDQVAAVRARRKLRSNSEA